MPDYFVDRFVRFESLDHLVSLMKKKSFEGGGGSVRGIKQSEIKGGNAVNIAYALGIFGANVSLTALANSLPEQMLVSTFSKFPNVTLDIIRGKAGYTIAFEFREHKRHVNVMVSDVGDLLNFDGSSISSDSLDSIKNSKIVTIVNWAANSKGNQLCERIFGMAKKTGAKTFFDPADVSGQRELLPELKSKVFDNGLIDFVSLNENEARIMSKVLFGHALPTSYSEPELIQTAKILSKGTNSIIDLHTQSVTISAEGADAIARKCHKVEQKTVTGAGDVWAAANLASYLSDIQDEDRLRFANAAAGLYVSRESAMTPSLREVYDFMISNEITAAQ
jgi:ribokinase